MPLIYQMDDSHLNAKLKGYRVTESAQESVTAAFNGYADTLIREIKHLGSNRSSSSTPEITAKTVEDAVSLIKMGQITKPVTWQIRILRILASVLPFFAGYIKPMLNLDNQLHLILFAVMAIFAVAFMVASILKD